MAYKTRLDSVKSYLKIRMNIFVKKVEKINMRVQRRKNQNNDGSLVASPNNVNASSNNFEL